MSQAYNIQQFERIEKNEQKLLKRIKVLEEEISNLKLLFNQFNKNSESNVSKEEQEGLIISNNGVTLNDEL